MVFNQKLRKPKLFRANAHKNAQGYYQPNKDSICYKLPVHTHDEDLFHRPQILKLAFGAHTETILKRDKNTMNFIKKYQRNCYKKGKT